MRGHVWFSSMFLLMGVSAAAQIAAPTNDILGAHLNYGRGCSACHAPHSGASGNGGGNGSGNGINTEVRNSHFGGNGQN